MLKAILLDLDNTLILYDELKYYKAYFKQLNEFFGEEMPPEELKERVLKGTMALGRNKGEKTNLECFLEVFADGLDVDTAFLWERFMDFYREVYDGIRVAVTVPDGLQDGLARLRQNGLKLVIASNPIFPVLAQQKRMRWGGIDPGWFDLFTHMENMRYVKPRTDYFHQACNMIGHAPGDCMMVGNDPVNDMAAGKAGLKTYRTTDAEVIDYASLTLTDAQRKKGPREIPRPDHEGPFSGVAAVVEKLLAGKN